MLRELLVGCHRGVPKTETLGLHVEREALTSGVINPFKSLKPRLGFCVSDSKQTSSILLDFQQLLS